MLKKIQSLDKITIITGQEPAYVSRELIKFIQNKIGFIAIYEEIRFNLIDFETTDGEGNNITLRIPNVLETLKQVPAKLTDQTVNSFFQLNPEGIKTLADYNQLQIDAMLYDTINQNNGKGRYNTKDWIIYKH